MGNLRNYATLLCIVHHKITFTLFRVQNGKVGRKLGEFFTRNCDVQFQINHCSTNVNLIHWLSDGM